MKNTVSYKAVNIYPHDTKAFTQGLAFHNGLMYESRGGYGTSALCVIDLPSGSSTHHRPLLPNHFAEGITIFNDRIYQLTWKEKTVLVYSLDLELEKSFDYQDEGWGITNDGASFITSDGTATLKFRDAQTLEEIRRIEVVDENGDAVRYLNALEYIDGEIWANVWTFHDRTRELKIAVISPEDGRVVRWVDLWGLPVRRWDDEQILNGIAYDSQTGRIFVTGKLWENVLEIVPV